MCLWTVNQKRFRSNVKFSLPSFILRVNLSCPPFSKVIQIYRHYLWFSLVSNRKYLHKSAKTLSRVFGTQNKIPFHYIYQPWPLVQIFFGIFFLRLSGIFFSLIHATTSFSASLRAKHTFFSLFSRVTYFFSLFRDISFKIHLPLNNYLSCSPFFLTSTSKQILSVIALHTFVF